MTHTSPSRLRHLLTVETRAGAGAHHVLVDHAYPGLIPAAVTKFEELTSSHEDAPAALFEILD